MPRHCILLCALVACLLPLAAVAGARGSRTLSSSHMNTWLTNHSSKDLVGTTSYLNFMYCSPTSQFVNRVIPAGKSDHDEYCPQSGAPNSVVSPGGTNGAAGVGTVNLGNSPRIGLEVWIKGASAHGKTAIPPDQSVLALDAVNGGVDIFLAKYGAPASKQDASKGPLVTLHA